MKRLLLFLPLSLKAATLFSILPWLSCPGTGPQLLLWNGTAMTCIPLGAGLTTSGGILNVASANYTPSWQIDVISLASLTPGSATIQFTPTQIPNNGTVIYIYQSTNLLMNTLGFINWTGSPMTITLPIGWLATDTVKLLYQFK